MRPNQFQKDAVLIARATITPSLEKEEFRPIARATATLLIVLSDRLVVVVFLIVRCVSFAIVGSPLSF